MRKQTRRKVWKLINPIAHVMDGIVVTPEEELDKIRIRELGAIEAFAKGHARLHEWHEMAAMLNVSEYLAGIGVGIEVKEVCRVVEGHLTDAANRYQRTKKMGLTGPGIQSLRELYEFHDIQRKCITRGDYEKAIRAAMLAARQHGNEIRAREV